MLRHYQHLKLEIVAICFDLEKLLGEGGGYGPESSLGIPQPQAKQRIDQPTRQRVSGKTSERRCGEEEAPYTEE